MERLMNRHPRLVFVSSVAVPQQVKFCSALQKYFDAEFWFYEGAERTRGTWWCTDLGSQCRILGNVLFLKSGPLAERYIAPGLTKELEAFDPDIVMLGGFSIPANISAHRWAKKHGKKTILFTEISRSQRGVLRGAGMGWRLLRWLYRGVDLVVTNAADSAEQFRNELGFGDRVVAGRYAADLEAYFFHPLREPKAAYTYLFANRMTETYNPIGALEIFAQVLRKQPGSRLLMNAAGELGDACRGCIARLGIGDAVEFLTDIKSWEHLHTVYARSDILILPATFSNGNFTILEAMASGMGVIVSDCVLGIGKMIRDGVNGFNCAPTTAEFVDRIERYISKPQLLKAHAELNRPIVEPLGAEGTAKFFADLVREQLRM